jgi:dolichol-phosphate mannosyltransferase
VLFFFSLSSSKLPTYIVPALPAICLLLGSFLTHVILPGSTSAAAALRGYLHYLRTSAPGHAAMAIAVLAIVAGIADIVFGPDAFAQHFLAGGVIVAAVVSLALAMVRYFPSATAGWSCAGAAALAVLCYAFTDVYPEGAWVRSELRQSAAELAEIRSSTPLVDERVVLFGALSEGMSLYADDAGLQKFNKDQARDFAAFAKQNPESLVIATRSHAANIAARLSQTQQLRKLPGCEFVYEVATVGDAAEIVARKSGDRTQ